MPLVVCESVAAIVFHLRTYEDPSELKFGGHAPPRPLSLCEREIAWDTKIPVRYTAVTCKTCRERSGLTPPTEDPNAGSDRRDH